MSAITKETWGKLPSGDPVSLYTLSNQHGIEAKITTYGGRLVSLKAPDRTGNVADIVLGFESLDGYLHKNPFFGALVGRYANRIAHAQFSLNGEAYTLARNNGENSLHGGNRGFDKVLWQAHEPAVDTPALELEYLSVDGEEGYPGNLQVKVRYTLTQSNELHLEYHATTDKLTVLNLTNHSYFNLDGSADVRDHELSIYAAFRTEVDADLIPTGEIASLDGTPLDFREPTPIGARLRDPHPQLALARGYDHNWVLRGGGGGELVEAARVHDPASGRALTCLTTHPGLQFYTGNFLDGTRRGSAGTLYRQGDGFTLETQHFPDSPNQPGFPSTVLRAGDTYRHSTAFRFHTL